MGPGRGLIQPAQTWLGPGASLFMLTKAARLESLRGHGAALRSPHQPAGLEKDQQPGRMPRQRPLVDWALRLRAGTQKHTRGNVEGGRREGFTW